MAGEVETLALLGDLPPSWTVARFGDVLEGGTRNGIYKPKEFHGRGAKVVNMGELFANPRLRNVPMKRVELSDSELEKSCLKQGDLLFARRSLVADGAGKCIVVAEVKEPTTFESSIIRARPNPRVVDSLFLYYLFNSPYGAYVLLTIRRQVAVSGITGTDLVELPVPLPPLAEQEAIAAVLGALDEKIELNRRMNATLEAMARALFQSWFVDFDPVRAKLDGRQPVGMNAETAALFPDSFQASPLGPIPSGWSSRDLGEMADFVKGLSYKGSGLADEGGMPMVNLGCFAGRGLFNVSRVKRYTGEYRERHLVHAGDLVIANTDMTQNRVIIGSPALVPMVNGEKEFLFTHHVFAVRFRPGTEIWRRFVFFTLLKPEFREIAEGFSTGTTVLALPSDGLVNYSLCLPPIPLLEVFEKQVDSLLARVDANNHESRTLATLRDTLLPKLLSGEVTAKTIPAVEEAVS